MSSRRISCNRPPRLRLLTLACGLAAGCSGRLASPTPRLEAPEAAATEWFASPADRARVDRLEASLAPFTVPGRPPLRLSLQQWMELYKVPGLSVAVFRDHRLLWARSYGHQQAGGPQRVTLRTLFQAASISKPVTALAALHLVEQGRFTLDEDINGRLRSWKVPESELTRVQKVTLRRLLSHSAGFAEHHGFPGYGVSEPLPSAAQILDGTGPANAPGLRLTAVPGTATRYNGGGFVLVQVMLSDQLGKPFAQVVREAVLEPLGLEEDTFEQPLPAALAGTAASGTTASGQTVEGRWHVYPEQGPAGWWTTATGLARVAIEVSKARAGTSRLLVSQAMAREMLTPQSDGYGLGFELGAADRFGHTGSNRGFKSTLIAFADSGSGVAMLANSDNGSKLFGRLASSLATEYGWSSVSGAADSPSVVADLLERTQGTEAALAWVRERLRAGAAPTPRSSVLNGLGYRLLEEHRVDDACKVFAANVDLFPDESNGHDSLGECLLQQGHRPEAVRSYRRALELDPTNTRARSVVDTADGGR